MSSARADNKVIVVTGPTASGKSALALELAEKLGGEIVSADSMQVYRLLDIGTAKPGPEERERIAHHLIDYVDLDEAYHVGRYLKDADAALTQLNRRSVVPIVCGGTALYLRALLFGLAEGPGRDVRLRAALGARWDAGEKAALWQELRRTDPALAARLHPNDRTRIIRGLEVYQASGRPQSSYHAEHTAETMRYQALQVGVSVPREELYRNIDRRVHAMLEAGWVAEVQQVLAAGYSADLAPLRAIGYRELCVFLRHGGNLAEVAAEVQKQTRRFAKRQLTWFRSMPLEWFSPHDVGGVLRRARKFLQTDRPKI